jgi:hypothetical protein
VSRFDHGKILVLGNPLIPDQYNASALFATMTDQQTSSQDQDEISSQASTCSDGNSQATGCTSRSALVYRTVIPKALPDLDDVSMSHVFQYIQLSEQDLYWSFLSDSLFIAGGVLYVILSLWDALHQQQQTLLYKIFEILAPLVYLFNSIIDVKWAFQVKQLMGARKAVTETWNDWRLLLDLDDGEAEDDQDGKSVCMTWYHRLRKHSAHRRTMISAFIFGIAAVFGLAAALLEVRNTNLSNVSNSISVYSYIVSAIFACSGKRTRPWLQSSDFRLHEDPERLEDFGDLLFLIGSIVDGVLLFLQLDYHSPGWGVLSSLFWCLDACFYLRSDVVMYTRLHQQHQEGSALV